MSRIEGLCAWCSDFQYDLNIMKEGKKTVFVCDFCYAWEHRSLKQKFIDWLRLFSPIRRFFK